LPHPDDHYVHRAEGWLDLGDFQEAERELESIALERRDHPEVLVLRWQIYSRAQRWNDCMAVADVLTKRFPENPCGWIVLAQTLYHTQRVAEAYKIGVSKAEEFPESWQLLYDTACYACLLRKRRKAQQYLHSAMEVGNAKEIRLRASQDPDLAALSRRS
jgi:predicted Zn-dependent protease